jgi:DNA invertase Pin-like site-specific DNA recombinase
MEAIKMVDRPIQRCAIYTRKSSENGLEQSFNSLHAQREACEAYIKSQAHEGWALRPTLYDDGGISGGHIERPALQALLNDIRRDLIDVVMVYKVDRLSRSLADFARLVELFEKHSVSFVSITQHFNTSSSMGRLTLNVLLSFAQFEREVTGERIRDKIAASKRKGMWMGGTVPFGFDVVEKKLVINPKEAKTVRHIFDRYLALQCVRRLKGELDDEGFVSKARANDSGGKPFSRGALYTLLKNCTYIGKVRHKEEIFDGEHKRIIDQDTWSQVDSLLKANRSKASQRSNAKAPSLLAGLLYDSRGNPMSPTHATKGGKRYRYYISQAVLKYEKNKEGDVLRVPAESVEIVCIEQIKSFLSNPRSLLKSLCHLGLAAHQQEQLIGLARQYADNWKQLTLHEQITHLKKIVERIELERKVIRIYIRLSAIIKILKPEYFQLRPGAVTLEDQHILTCPAQLKRCGIETRLVASNGPVTLSHPESTKAIQKALRRALVWNQALLNGAASTLTEIAKKEKVEQRYICDLIKLAYLAPDIIEAIIEGKIPVSLTLDKLKKMFSINWRKQRQVLDF